MKHLFISMLCLPLIAAVQAQPGIPGVSPNLKIKYPAGSTAELNAGKISSTTALLDSFIISRDFNLIKVNAETFYTSRNAFMDSLTANKYKLSRVGTTDYYFIQNQTSSFLALVSNEDGKTMVSMKPCSVPTAPQLFAEVNKIVASDRINNAQFGQAVAISSNFAAVGVRLEDKDASGSNPLNDAGAVYIFERGANNKWKQIQKIVATDRAAGDNFGYSVGISGNYIVVGAPYEDEDVSLGNTMLSSGSAYVFERNANGIWTQTQKIVPARRYGQTYFGTSVAIDRRVLVVGAIGHSYDETEKLEGNFTDAGALYVFQLNGANWTQRQKIVANDHAIGNLGDNLGNAVSISGYRIIAGAWAADLDANSGNRVESAGAAYIFERGDDGRWRQAQKLVASDRAPYDEFGFSVGISGDYAIVGAERKAETNDPNARYYTGSAYLFTRNEAGGWTEVQKLIPADKKAEDRLGWSVAINGGYAIIGAPGSDVKQMSNEGAVYVYWQNPQGKWVQSQKLNASDKGVFAGMATAVALSKNSIIAGAFTEHRDVQGKNELSNAGAAYLFVRGIDTRQPAAKAPARTIK